MTAGSDDEPLAAANELFHAAYTEARDETAREGPILVLLAAELVLFHRGERRAFPVDDPLFHALKAVAHVPIAVYAALHGHGDDAGRDHALDAAARAKLERMRAHLADAAPREPWRHEPAARVVADLGAALESFLEYVDRVLADGRIDACALDDFARGSRKALLRLTDHATHLQIDALHHAVCDALASLARDDRRDLHVVVAGDHQARERSLGMQYFQRRIGPRDGDGSAQRVVYGENVTTAEEARALIGTRRLDRAIAVAFFGDADRLQRDVLGDAAKARLDVLDLAPIS